MPIINIDPIIRSPISDILGVFGNNQMDKRCRELELNLADCLDVYGRKGLVTKCRDEFSDLLECVHAAKSQKRIAAMQQERTRQYLSGERPKEKLYAEAPKIDSYVPTYGRKIDS